MMAETPGRGVLPEETVPKQAQASGSGEVKADQNPVAVFLRGVGILASGLAEAGRWYERNEPQIRHFSEGAAQVVDSLPNWLSLCAVTFARGGWSEAPLGQMNLSESTALVERLRDKPDEEVRRELDRAVPEYFRCDDHAKLRELVERWDNEHFRQRRRIFDDALWAHTQDRYTLPIHALAPQIEGVLRDATGVHKREEKNLWRKRFNEAFDFVDASEQHASPDWDRKLMDFWSLSRNERYEQLEAFRVRFALLRINELYISGNFSNPEFISTRARRHPIAHGVFNNYGEIESLRLFCALDLLHDAVGEYKRLQTARQESGADPSEP